MNPRSCTRCGAPLGPASLDALCPRCLMGATSAVLGLESAPGERVHYFGDYELIQEIARGGMGVVFAARQVSLNRIVAVKRLLESALATPEQVRRFRAEAEAAARLRHPNIVGIHEIGEHEGQHYFSMEYIEGENLAELVRDNPLAPRRAAALLKTIAGAVAYAHAQGVLHRDLKPSNVLVDEQDQPHVTDFGLAKILTGQGEITVSGQVLGTPAYMSPEQGEGNRRAIGPASDVYSLGALLYHLLTGRPPFVAETPLETLRQAREEEPVAPRALNASVPRDLETICLKCLAKDPARRYGSATELEADLGRYLAGEPILARPVGPWERAWRWWKREPKLAGAIGLAVLLLALLAAGAGLAAYRVNAARGRELQERQRAETNAVLLAAQRKEAVATVTQLAIVSAESAGKEGDAGRAVAFLSQALRQDPSNRVVLGQLVSRLTQNEFAAPAFPPLPHPAPVHHAQFSPDGSRIVTACADGVVRLWDALGGRVILQLKGHTGVVSSAKFSPDGRFLASAGHDGTIRVWETDSGRMRFAPLANPAAWSTADFSPDGAVIAAVRRGGVFFWDARNGESLGLGFPHEPALTHRAVHCSVAFGPDSRRFLTVATNRVRLLMLGTTNNSLKRLGGGADDPLMTHAALSPDGTRVVAASASDVAYLWDITTNTPGVPLRGHQENVVFAGFSPDGSRLVTAATDKSARLWDGHSGRPLAPPLLHDGWVVFARFSDDGLKLLTLADDRTVRVWDARTGQRIGQPIEHQGEVLSAEFSPDGTRLVIAAGQPWAQVWDIRTSRARPEVHRDFSGTHNLDGKFDANGRTLVGAKTALWRFDSLEPQATIRARLGADTASAGLHWGPHGSWFIARLTNGACRLHAYPGGRPLTAPFVHLGPVLNIAFSADGSLCLTIATNQAGYLWETRTGRLLRDTFRHESLILDPVFSPDGRRLLLACDDHTFCAWDVAEGRPVGGPFARDRNAITDAAFSSDGRRLVTLQYGNTGLLREADTGRPIGVPLAHDQPLLCAQFSPDGRMLVTTSEDETARLWNAHDGTPLTESLRHSSPVLWAAFSPDNLRLATFCEDGTARLWDTRLGQPLGEPMRLGGRPARGEFTGDGQRVIVSLQPMASTNVQPILRQIWVTPAPPAPAPSWLPGFVESWAGRRILEGGQAVWVPVSDYFAAREAVLRSPGPDYYVSLARWLSDDRATRPVAPWANQRVPEYVAWLLEDSRAERLLETGREAALLDPTDARALAQLSLALSARGRGTTGGTPTGSLAQALHLGRRATQLAPRLPAAWLALGQASGLAGGPAGALAAIEEGLKELPADLVLLSGRVSQLQHLGRKVEAVKACDDALKVAEADPVRFANERRELLARRATLLQPPGRPQDANPDRSANFR